MPGWELAGGGSGAGKPTCLQAPWEHPPAAPRFPPSALRAGWAVPLLEFEAGQPLTCPRRPASQGLPCWGPRCWPAPTSSPRLLLHLHHPLSSRALLSPGARPPVHSEEGPAFLFLAGAAAARMLPAPPPIETPKPAVSGSSRVRGPRLKPLPAHQPGRDCPQALCRPPHLLAPLLPRA